MMTAKSPGFFVNKVGIAKIEVTVKSADFTLNN